MTEEERLLFPQAMPVNPATRTALCINTYCRDASGNDKQVGSGTGFFYRHADRDWLVTNWHVVTGRRPITPFALLDGFPDSPTSIELWLPTAENPHHLIPSALFPLYIKGEPQWLEAEAPAKPRGDGHIVDLVALPFTFPDGLTIPTIGEFIDEPILMRSGADVLIVGYPFGIHAENPYALWKRGFIASEPSTLLAGMPKFYIDAPGRPGMSGSPVFLVKQGFAVSKATKQLLAGNAGSALDRLMQLDPEELASAPDAHVLRFAGVYSGSVGDDSLEQLRVGVAWNAVAVDWLFTRTAKGYNPVPPVNL